MEINVFHYNIRIGEKTVAANTQKKREHTEKTGRVGECALISTVPFV